MPPQTSDYGPVSNQSFFAAVIVASALITTGLWVVLIRFVPELNLGGLLTPPPPTSSLVNVAIYAAIILGTALPFFWVNLRLADIVGHFVFTRLVMSLAGLAMITGGLLFMWSSGAAFTPIVPSLMVGAGVFLSAIGVFPNQIYRHVVRLGCLSAVAIACVAYALGEEKNALIVGVIAILLAIGLTDFLGLGRIVQGQATAEWQASKGRLFFAVVILAIGVALEGFFKVYYIDNTGPQNRMSEYGVTAGLVGLYVLLFGASRLFKAIFRLSGSLIPTGRPNLNTVTKQKVHGQAGYATADQVDAALRDQDHGAGSAPHFRD